MDWLNYHHLYYFYNVAREGSIARACEKLHVAQPTISGQLKALEEALGEKLFTRSGRSLVLTDTGHTVYRYAEEIFSLGRELVDTVQGRPTGGPMRLVVGIADVLPKLIVSRILARAFDRRDPIQVTVREGKADRLLSELSLHGLDLVLADEPISPSVRVRAYNHLLGECGVTVFGTPELAASHADDFPAALDGAPFLLPTDNTSLRRSLDQWFESQGIRPRVVGEFEDSALLKSVGQSGNGLFVAPTAIEAEVGRQYQVEPVGRVTEVVERFYGISIERKIKHPAVSAIVETTRHHLFNGGRRRSV